MEDKRHIEYLIQEMNGHKIIAKRVSDRGHVMITEEQAATLNESPCEKGYYYELDGSNPTNKGAKQIKKSEVTRPTRKKPLTKNETIDKQTAKEEAK